MSTLRPSLKELVKRSAAGRYLLVPHRLKFALGCYWPSLKQIIPWLVTSRETTNLTYETTDASKQYMASLVSLVAACEPEKVLEYIAELDNDSDLLSHVRCITEKRRDYVADPGSRPGRRAIYYALVRALKPRVVVEAGIDKGFGTCIIAAALKRNYSEGSSGYVYGVDLRQEAGYLFRHPYEEHGRVVIADSCQFLRGFEGKIDLFIHDTVNDEHLEQQELGLLESVLDDNAVVLNVWHTGTLMRFAWETGRAYLVFRDCPKGHWYPGSVVGIAFPKRYRNPC